MAETVKIVDPDNGAGTDYLSLNAWESGEAGDQATNDPVAECRSSSGSADTTDIQVNGFTNYGTIKIRNHSSEYHGGTWNTSTFRIEPSLTSSMGIRVLLPNFLISGIQITVANTPDSGRSGIFSIGQDNVQFDHLIIKGKSGASGIGIYSTGTGPQLTYNCLIYDWNGTSGRGFQIETLGTSKYYAYNNTVDNCVTGYYSSGGSDMVSKNNIAQNCTTCFGSGMDTTNSEYNLSDDTTAPGSNATTSTSVTFVNITSDDYHLASSDTAAIDTGNNYTTDANLSFSDDIDKQTRGSTWDRGADEYVSTGTLVNATKASVSATTFAATITLGAATNVTSTKASVAASTLIANVNAIKHISATKASIASSTLSASINVGTNISATKQNLNVSTYLASVNAIKHISATKSSVASSTLAASVNATTHISSILKNVSVSTYQASVNVGTSITATKQNLNVSTYLASINVGTSINAFTQNANVSTYQATINAKTFITSILKNANVSTYLANVNLGKVVHATKGSISASTYQASVTTKTHVFSILQNASISGLLANVNAVKAISASVQNLNVTAYQGSITRHKTIYATLQNSNISSYVANVNAIKSISATVGTIGISTYRPAIGSSISILNIVEKNTYFTVSHNEDTYFTVTHNEDASF